MKMILKDGIIGISSMAGEAGGGGGRAFILRIGNALRVAVSDFLDISGLFHHRCGHCFALQHRGEPGKDPSARRSTIGPATFSLMGFAIILSLCSTSDAFIAATFLQFPAVAKLGFPGPRAHARPEAPFHL